METTNIIINNFEDLNNAMQNNPLHILTENEGWETLFPETQVNLDKLIDIPLPENLNFYPYSLHIYQTPDQLIHDIEHNIDTVDLLNMGDDDFYDYMPCKIRCIIKGFEILKSLNYQDQISKLASELLEQIQEASQTLDDSEFETEYVELFSEDIQNYI